MYISGFKRSFQQVTEKQACQRKGEMEEAFEQCWKRNKSIVRSEYTKSDSIWHTSREATRSQRQHAEIGKPKKKKKKKKKKVRVLFKLILI